MAIPAVIVTDLEHLAAYRVRASWLVFIGAKGDRMRRGSVRRSLWVPAVESVGVSGLWFHDLRHTGNTPCPATGASTRELMVRMDRASSRAA